MTLYGFANQSFPSAIPALKLDSQRKYFHFVDRLKIKKNLINQDFGRVENLIKFFYYMWD